MPEESYVDTSRVSLREINSKVAKDLIVKYHYLMHGLCVLVLSVYELTYLCIILIRVVYL